jgi:DNA polymerase-3 subunit gamma/tau
MALRSENEPCAQPDPVWLNDLPKPSGKPTTGVAPSNETIPTPPAKATDGSTSNLGDGFKMQPAAASDTTKAAETTSKPELGEGFKLETHAPQSEPTGEEAKPALRGLEPTPAKPAENAAPSVPDTGAPAPAATPSRPPTDTPFVPEPTPTSVDAAPATLPSLVPEPEPSPQGN